jgi:hypothetical protein
VDGPDMVFASQNSLLASSAMRQSFIALKKVIRVSICNLNEMEACVLALSFRRLQLTHPVLDLGRVRAFPGSRSI